MTLDYLSDLGLPGWLIIVAASLFILKQVGLMDFITSRIADYGEFEQSQIEAGNAARQSEQVALWSQMTRLQTKALEQNELLLNYVIDQSAEWNKQHNDKIDRMLEQQKAHLYEMRQLAAKMTIIISLFDREQEKANDPKN